MVVLIVNYDSNREASFLCNITNIVQLRKYCGIVKLSGKKNLTLRQRDLANIAISKFKFFANNNAKAGHVVCLRKILSKNDRSFFGGLLFANTIINIQGCNIRCPLHLVWIHVKEEVLLVGHSHNNRLHEVALLPEKNNLVFFC